MAFQKGHKLATGRPIGSKNRSTLLQEERRAIFDEQVSQMWEETVKKLRPEYIADQFMGTATKKVDVTTKGEKLPEAQRFEELFDKLEDELDTEGTG